MVATWAVYYANGANPDGQKGVARVPYLPECNPCYPLTPAMPASQFSTIIISHPPCTVALYNKASLIGNIVPVVLTPASTLTEQPPLPFIGHPLRDTPFVYAASSSNSASLWLNPHKSYDVTRHTARSLCDQLF